MLGLLASNNYLVEKYLPKRSRLFLLSNFIFLVPQKPSLTIKPKNTVFQGASASFICSISREKSLTYIWYKDGKQIEWNQKVIFVEEIFLTLEGKYQCAVNDGYQLQKSEELTLTVQCRLNLFPIFKKFLY